ncbi:MAG: cyclic nucleotide-binding domain-containing protein, partial [Ardenticatenales bacterium]|nr:cyclic nucleotide-binding domain-containing protein [Ardenticatenales bacterium]
MDTAEKAMFLGHVSIFAEVHADVLFAVSKHMEEVALRPGQVVFRKGDSASCLYIVTEGKVKVEDPDTGVFYNYLRVFDVFGEMGMVDEAPRMATVSAVEESLLLKLDRDVFLQIMTVEDRVALGVIKVLSRHLRERAFDIRAGQLEGDRLRELAELTQQAKNSPP